MFKIDTAGDAPKVIYLKDYQKPDYFITHVNLNFDLKEDVIIVTSCLTFKREKTGASSIGVCQKAIWQALKPMGVTYKKSLTASKGERRQTAFLPAKD